MRARALLLASLLLVGPCAAVRRVVIFLHGSGDTGDGLVKYLTSVADGRFIKAMSAAGVETVYPSATPIPYTLARGKVMSNWFDRTQLSPAGAEHLDSIEESRHRLEKVIDDLVKGGVPSDHIAIGGFSMGGGMALQLALRTRRPLAAAFALSSYLCRSAEAYGHFYTDECSATRHGRTDDAACPAASLPVFMRHGSEDSFILPAWGAATAERLKSLGLHVDAAELPGLGHEMRDDEIDALVTWLLPKLGVFEKDEL